MQQKTDQIAEQRREQRKQESWQIQEWYRQTNRDLLITVRWLSTILAAILMFLTINALFTDRQSLWPPYGPLAALWMTYLAWRGWYYYRRQSKG